MDAGKFIPSVNFTGSTTINDIIRSVMKDEKFIEKLTPLGVNAKELDESLQTVLGNDEKPKQTQTQTQSQAKSIDIDTLRIMLTELRIFESMRTHSISISSQGNQINNIQKTMNDQLLDIDNKIKLLKEQIDKSILTITCMPFSNSIEFQDINSRFKVINDELFTLSSKKERMHSQMVNEFANVQKDISEEKSRGELIQNQIEGEIMPDILRMELEIGNIKNMIDDLVTRSNTSSSVNDFIDRINSLEQKLNVISSSIETTDHSESIAYLSQKMEFKDKSTKDEIKNINAQLDISTALELETERKIKNEIIPAIKCTNSDITIVHQRIDSTNKQLEESVKSLTDRMNKFNDDNSRLFDHFSQKIEHLSGLLEQEIALEEKLKETLDHKHLDNIKKEIYDSLKKDIVENRIFFANKMKSLDDKLDTVASSIEKTDHTQTIEYLSQKLEFKDKNLNDKINGLQSQLNSMKFDINSLNKMTATNKNEFSMEIKKIVDITNKNILDLTTNVNDLMALKSFIEM
jgi:hypothetical protein